MRQYAHLLKQNRDIRLIWFSEITNLIGDWFSQVVLGALVISLMPDHAGLAISTLIVARFLPPLILSPQAGSLLDRFNRQRMLVWSNWLRAVIGLVHLLPLFDPSLVWLIYVGVVAQSTLATVYPPGLSALIASVVKPTELVTANTLSNATWSAALAAGGALGGIVAAAFGSATALLIDALSFVIAGALIAGVRGYVPTPPDPSVDAAQRRRDASVRDGLRYIRQHKPTLATIFVKFGSSLGNVDTVMAVLATQIFVMGVNGSLSLGIFYSAFGVGAVLGPLIANAIHDGSGRSLRRWIWFGFAIQAVGWLVIGQITGLLVVCIGIVMRAMGGSVNWTYSSVLLQRTTPDRYRGRVFSIDNMLYYVATVFATLIHGTLIDMLGPHNMGWIGAGTAVVSMLPLLGWSYALRRWREPVAEGAG
ncbi:MAG: MFS transporter [Chloroflexi bacterium]|nr:MFS transporter [Chloroflexota bacterium]